MKHANFLGITAISIWLTNLVFLWPLPPVEAAQTIQYYQTLLAEPSPQSLSNWNERSVSEKKRTEESWENLQEELRHNINEERELEIALWVKWCARFILIVIAIAGWLLFALQRLRQKIVLPTTTLLLIAGYAIFYSANYSEIAVYWKYGSMLFSKNPWGLVIAPILNFYVAPTFLCVITIAAFYGRNFQNEGNNK
jgi:hypothetical protein